jgi:hypothetical protein
MFCLKCRCEYIGWEGSCPACKIPLVDEKPFEPLASSRLLTYDELVETLRENNGQVEIELAATDVGLERKRRFPYSGYGLAWVKRLQGAWDGIAVDLEVSGVGLEKKWGFPYQGYGFAWAQGMQGNAGGNEITLTTNKVHREKNTAFFYRGYGQAWAGAMSGACGDQIIAEFTTTNVGRHSGWQFPYSGYGFAWANRGTLTLTLRE